MKLLSPRLELLKNWVTPCEKLADVGCDHGYLICHLLQSGTIKKGYACDISAPSLQKAANLAKKSGLELECICTDGLKDVPPCNTVVIAGMGGILIADILAACSWIKDSDVTLLLQPMRHPERLRAFLYQNGFCCVREACVCDSGRYYVAMQAVYTGQKSTLSSADSHLGLLEGDTTPQAVAYFSRLYHQMQISIDANKQAGRDVSQAEKLLWEIKIRRGEI